MTTINDITDLIRILRNDPDWAEAVRSVLLSQELQKLPEEFATLTRAFREHADNTNRRLESLEAGQDELRQGQAQLHTSVNGLHTSVDGLQTSVDGLQTSVNGMRGELGNLSGSFFQRRAGNFAGRVARRDFHLRQTSLVHHADQVGDSILKQMLDDAAEDASRNFTEDQAAQIEQADAVIAGKAPDGTTAYLLVEASITIVKGDVDRARNRAELLTHAVGTTTHALVIGESITGEAAAQAKDTGVAFAAFTPRRTPAQDPGSVC